MMLPLPMAPNRWFAAAMALWMKRDDDGDCSNPVPTTTSTSNLTPGSSKDEQAATKRQLPTNTQRCLHRSTAANENENPNPNAFAFAFAFARCASMVLRILRATVAASVVATLCFAALYRAASAPPLQLWYDRAPDAGPSSVYLPGGGFSGFWFHLGYLHALAEGKHGHRRGHKLNCGNESENENENDNGNGNSEHGDLHDYDYYCYSSGCLGILSVFLNRSLEEVYGAALASQNAWIDGNQSRFEIVDYFFERLVPPEEDFAALYNNNNDYNDDYNNDYNDDDYNELPLGTSSNATDFSFLPRIKILVTTASEGYRVVESRTRTELKENIRKTTFVPFLTGWGWFFRSGGDTDTGTDIGTDIGSSTGFANGSSSNLDIDNGKDKDKDNELYLDGGFSRVLHPRCEAEWHLPVLWDTLIHTFSPGLSREQVQTLWESGYGYTQFPLPSVPRSASRGEGACVCAGVCACAAEGTNASRATGGASEPAATETLGRKTNAKTTVVSNAGIEPGQRTRTHP